MIIWRSAVQQLLKEIHQFPWFFYRAMLSILHDNTCTQVIKIVIESYVANIRKNSRRPECESMQEANVVACVKAGDINGDFSCWKCYYTLTFYRNVDYTSTFRMWQFSARLTHANFFRREKIKLYEQTDCKSPTYVYRSSLALSPY